MAWEEGQLVKVNYIRFGEDKIATAKIIKVHKNGTAVVAGWGNFNKMGEGMGNMGFSTIQPLGEAT